MKYAFPIPTRNDLVPADTRLIVQDTLSTEVFCTLVAGQVGDSLDAALGDREREENPCG